MTASFQHVFNKCLEKSCEGFNSIRYYATFIPGISTLLTCELCKENYILEKIVLLESCHGVWQYRWIGVSSKVIGTEGMACNAASSYEIKK